MIILESEYDLGQIVYLKTDPDQKKRMVKQICFSHKGIEFNLIHGTETTWHADFELSVESDILIKTGVE